MTSEDETKDFLDELRTALEPYELEYQRDFVPSRPGVGFSGSGLVDGQRVTVTAERAVGRDHWRSFMISGSLALDLGLRVEPKGTVRSPTETATDPEAFSEAYEAKGDEPARVKALLSREVCAAILALGALGVEVRVTDTGVEARFTRRTLDFEPTLRGIVRAARSIEASVASVPPPAALAGALEGWQKYAKQNGLQLSRSPFRMQGNGIAAQAMRLSPTQYETQVSVAMPAPLEVGLSLRPAGKLEHYVEMVAGRDLQWGDPPFDRAFTVHAERPEAVVAAFDSEVRNHLRSLLAHGEVGFNDHGVSLRSKRHADVPAAIDTMRAIVTRVHASSKAS